MRQDNFKNKNVTVVIYLTSVTFGKLRYALRRANMKISLFLFSKKYIYLFENVTLDFPWVGKQW